MAEAGVMDQPLPLSENYVPVCLPQRLFFTTDDRIGCLW